MLSGIDYAELGVAAVATAGYALTSVILQRIYRTRRKRDLRRDARFVARLIDGARTGTVQTLSDVNALDAGEVSLHRQEWLIRRAVLRLLRRSSRTSDNDATARIDREAGIVLRRLLHHSQAATMEELVRKAGVADEDRDRIRLEAARQIERATTAVPVAGHLRIKRRDSQRKTASLMRRGLVGIGCVAFVLGVLVVWESIAF